MFPAPFPRSVPEHDLVHGLKGESPPPPAWSRPLAPSHAPSPPGRGMGGALSARFGIQRVTKRNEFAATPTRSPPAWTGGVGGDAGTCHVADPLAKTRQAKPVAGCGRSGIAHRDVVRPPSPRRRTSCVRCGEFIRSVMQRIGGDAAAPSCRYFHTSRTFALSHFRTPSWPGTCLMLAGAARIRVLLAGAARGGPRAAPGATGPPLSATYA
jgi:hypothetical protein